MLIIKMSISAYEDKFTIEEDGGVLTHESEEMVDSISDAIGLGLEAVRDNLRQQFPDVRFSLT